MKVLLLGLNYAPERIGIAIYTTGLAEALVRAGHQVDVVAGRPYYPGWASMDGERPFAVTRGRENGVAVTRVPHYVPANPTGGRRLLHHLSFALSCLLPMLWRGLVGRPDMVIAIAPSLLAAPVARLVAALSGAASWLHLQDFEVDAAVATNLLGGRGRLAEVARWFERVVLRSFATVSTISPQMGRKLLDKGVAAHRIVEFRNWADIEAISPLTGVSPLHADWGIKTPHVALYAGNIGNKQGIEIVVGAAKQLRHRNDLTFVICGEGPNRAHLEAQAAGLGNVVFQDLQAKARLNDLLGLASIHLLPQLAGAADLMLPSKLANMLASGRPVVATAAPGTGLAMEVEGCGAVSMPGDVDAFASAIVGLLDSPDRQAYGAAARLRAETRWRADRILDGLELSMRERARPEQSLATLARSEGATSR